MTRAALDDVIAEARWVVENPSPRNVADLKAALAEWDGAQADNELIPGRDDPDFDQTPGVMPPVAPCSTTPDGS